MNLGTLRSRVSGEIGLSNAAGGSEQLLIDGWANEAVVEFLRLTKCYVKPFSMALTADVGDYDLPSSLLAFKSLFLTPNDGSNPPQLNAVSSAEIMYRRQYQSSVVRPNAYALEGSNLLMIYPNAVSSSDTLGGLYVPKPTEMSDAAHDPSTSTYGGIPTEFHPALEAYTKWKAASWDDDSSSQIGLAYKGEWLERVKEAKQSLNRKGGVRWAPAVPKRSRRFRPNSPGVDTGR